MKTDKSVKTDKIFGYHQVTSPRGLMKVNFGHQVTSLRGLSKASVII